MSLNNLKDALKNYQNISNECIGVTIVSSTSTQGKADKNLALPPTETKMETPNTIKISAHPITQEKDTSVQIETDEDILQQPPSQIEKKEGFYFIPILIFFIFIILCGIVYVIYNFYS